MSKVEKVIIVITLVFVIVFGVSTCALISAVHDAGGISEVIIEAGKDIKDISRKIDEH